MIIKRELFFILSIFFIPSLLEGLFLGLDLVNLIQIVFINLLSILIISFFQRYGASIVKSIAFILILLYSWTTPYFFYLLKNNEWWLQDVHNININDEYLIISVNYLFLITILLFLNTNLRFYLRKFFLNKTKLKIIRFYSDKIKDKYSTNFIIFLISFLKKRSLLFLFLLILLILRIYAFQNGIGITGLEQKALPFKLTGIIYISINILSPIILGIYLINSYSLPINSLIVIFSIFNAILAGSKGIFLLTFMGLIINKIILFISSKISLRKFFISIISLFATLLISLILINSIKSNLLAYSDGNIEKIGIGDAIEIAIEKNQEKDFNEIFIATKNLILNRFDGINNIFISSKYNSKQVRGGRAFNRLGKIWHRQSFYKENPGDHHLQWVGNEYKLGFYLGGGIGSDMMIIFKENYLLFIVFISQLSIYCFFVEIFLGFNSLSNNIFRNIGCYLLAFVAITDIGSTFWYNILLIIFIFFKLKFNLTRK